MMKLLSNFYYPSLDQMKVKENYQYWFDWQINYIKYTVYFAITRSKEESLQPQSSEAEYISLTWYLYLPTHFWLRKFSR